MKVIIRLALLTLFPFLLLLSNMANANLVKGIYLTQTTLEDTALLNYLITHAKKAGITTFVVDLERPSQKSQQNAALITNNNIHYVARIIVYPSGGGTPEQVANKAIWEKKYALIQKAIAYGATEIQLDYIRYNTKQKASEQNARNIFKIIQWFKDKLAAEKTSIPLQVDVFGISSFGPELHIGQDITLISKTVDVLCPMIYPSHFEPYIHHSEHPYETIYDSLASIKSQFDNKLTFKLYPYIELSNYRYPLSHNKKMAYIRAQIKAVEDSNADGWYAWSPHNYYDNLFAVLETTKVK